MDSDCGMIAPFNRSILGGPWQGASPATANRVEGASLGMNPTAINRLVVRQALDQMRHAKPLDALSLVDMQALHQRVRREDRPDTPADRARALAELLRQIIIERLAAERHASSSAVLDEPERWADLETLIWADFGAGSRWREAWSCLFYRYVSRHELRIQQLSDLTQPPTAKDPAKEINRRLNRGLERLTLSLQTIETAALAASLDEVEAAPTPPPDARPVHLPPRPRTAFIGAQRALTDIAARLRGPGLLTLVGVGGVGKTRVARQVIDQVLDRFPDGLWFVELAPLADPGLVPLAVARVVGVSDQGNAGPIESLIEVLAGKPRALLVLDNCEHVLGACAELADALLAACPSLTLLATSRERLNIDAERLWPVPALTLPTAADVAAPERLAAESDAVQLFLVRAQAAKPEFRLTLDNAGAVADLCQRLAGLPLAIELAAAHARSLPAHVMLRELDDPLRLLSGRQRDAPSRQQTMEAAIAWSYNLLTETEKVLFARLAVFRGGWTVEAAEAVGTGGLVAAEQIWDLLFSLADKSLVVVEPEADDIRCHYLEVIRHFAQARLDVGPDAKAARRRHAEVFLALAERAEPELKGADQVAWLDRLEAEHDNLRAALAWAKDRRETELGQRLCGALWYFWYLRGHLTEGRGHCEVFLRRGGDAIPPAVRAKVLHAAGTLASYQGEHDTAATHLKLALEIRTRLDDRPGMADTLSNLAADAWLAEDLTTALAYYQQSLRVAMALEDSWKIANTLTNMARTAFMLGDLRSARAYQAEALALAQALNDRAMHADALYVLGTLNHWQGELASGSDQLREALKLQRGLKDRRIVIDTLINLAYVRVDARRFASARLILDIALARSEALADAWCLCETRICRGWLNFESDRLSEAQDEFQMALPGDRRRRMGAADALQGLASVALRAADSASARRLLKESLSCRLKSAFSPRDIPFTATLADLAALEENTEAILYLAAAIEASCLQSGFQLSPVRSSRLCDHVAVAKSRVSGQRFEVAWANGSVMTLREAAEYALSPDEQAMRSGTH